MRSHYMGYYECKEFYYPNELKRININKNDTLNTEIICMIVTDDNFDIVVIRDMLNDYIERHAEDVYKLQEAKNIEQK